MRILGGTLAREQGAGRRPVRPVSRARTKPRCELTRSRPCADTIRLVPGDAPQLRPRGSPRRVARPSAARVGPADRAPRARASRTRSSRSVSWTTSSCSCPSCSPPRRPTSPSTASRARSSRSTGGPTTTWAVPLAELEADIRPTGTFRQKASQPARRHGDAARGVRPSGADLHPGARPSSRGGPQHPGETPQPLERGADAVSRWTAHAPVSSGSVHPTDDPARPRSPEAAPSTRRLGSVPHLLIWHGRRVRIRQGPPLPSDCVVSEFCREPCPSHSPLTPWLRRHPFVRPSGDPSSKCAPWTLRLRRHRRCTRGGARGSAQRSAPSHRQAGSNGRPRTFRPARIDRLEQFGGLQRCVVVGPSVTFLELPRVARGASGAPGLDRGPGSPMLTLRSSSDR